MRNDHTYPRAARTPTTLLTVALLGLAVLSVRPVTGARREAPSSPGPPLSALGDKADLDDCLEYAALNNAGMKAAFNRWKAALERVPQLEALPDPRFTYGYFIENVETRVGPQEHRFGVMQMFPWFGKLRLRGDAALEMADALRQAYEQTKLNVFFRVEAAYHDYWYLKRALAITREHIRLVTNLEGVARTRFKVGAAPHSAVIQAQVELGKLDDRLRTLEAMRGPLVAKLNAALNRPPDAELPWPSSIPDAPVTFSDAQARARLTDANPELKRLDHLAAKAEVGIRLARREYYPDFSLGVDYVATGEAVNPDTPDSGNDPVVATVAIDLPIWRGKNKAALREAEYAKLAALDQRTEVEQQLQVDLSLALFSFRDAERKIDLYADTLVPQAEQSVGVAQQGFEAGKVGFIALIDAQRLLLEFQLAHQRARADRGKGLAEIERLVGKELGGSQR